MRTRRHSICIALGATIVGLVVFFYDDVLDHTDLHGTLLHQVTRSIEFVLLGPGMGVLAFTLCEYLRLAHERLRMERERARQKRLMLLGRIAASIAHEVRNPLHNLRLLLDEQRLHGASGSPALEARVQANLERINRAVELVYQLASPTAPPSEVEVGTDVNPLVREALAAVSQNGAPDVTVQHAPGPALVACPAVVVRIALDNLLRNALAAAREVEVQVRSATGAWEVEVRNPGQLPAEALDDDEDDTGAVVPSTSGLGLGLFISRRLVRNAGGSLILRQLGGHVSAIIRLPAWEASA